MDTVFWLLNFPVSHGYPIIFIAGFSFLGLALFSFRSVGGGGSRLTAVRDQEGLPESSPGAGRRVTVRRAERMGFRILAVVVIAGFVLGLLGISGVPVTHGYIYDNGVPTSATVDGEWVTFTAEDGTTYTIENNFFTPALYPDHNAWVTSDAPVTVRYLRSHPQAFVIDTTQLPE